MDNNELDNRKSIRRQHRKTKKLDKDYLYKDKKDEHLAKKQFKTQKRRLIEEDTWDNWEDEVY